MYTNLSIPKEGFIKDNMTPMGRLCTRPQADNKSNIEELRTLYLGLKAEKSSVALPASVVIEDAPRRATITAI